ncbi:hypothetical protein [Nocardia cyriacigeorgica]|uniref:hypothetical protein n=1 Tax=Nocardia cyriacigeorgica TaxID=135487 RepID=UPI002B4AC02C|nr:hypothetical protein [Nocardia cyriacigeorgica]
MGGTHGHEAWNRALGDLRQRKRQPFVETVGQDGFPIGLGLSDIEGHVDEASRQTTLQDKAMDRAFPAVHRGDVVERFGREPQIDHGRLGGTAAARRAAGDQGQAVEAERGTHHPERIVDGDVTASGGADFPGQPGPPLQVRDHCRTSDATDDDRRRISRPSGRIVEQSSVSTAGKQTCLSRHLGPHSSA